MARKDKASILSWHILLVYRKSKFRFLSADIFVQRTKNDVDLSLLLGDSGDTGKKKKLILALCQFWTCSNLNSESLVHVRPFPVFLLWINSAAYHQFCSKPEWFIHNLSVPQYLSVSNLVWFYHLCPGLK